MQQRKCFMKIFLVLALFSIGYTVTNLYVLYSQKINIQPVHYYQSGGVSDLFSCTHLKMGRWLTSIDTISPLNAIFFHEITCQRGLRIREACSVESAARANPDRQVFVVFARSLTLPECTTGVLAELVTIPNINYYIMDLNTYADNTPIDKVPLSRLVSLGIWSFAKIKEMFNILTVYKFGGTVIDLDVMVVRSLGKFGSTWVSREGDSFESAIVSIIRGLRGIHFTSKFFSTLKRQITVDFGYSMESSVKEFLKALCNTSNVEEMTKEKCKGLSVYSSEFFTAGNHSWADLKATNDSYVGYYLWKKQIATMPVDSLYADLAGRYCPTIYRKFMTEGNEDLDVIQLQM